MKLKYFISFFALVALLVSCSDDDAMTLLDEIQVSSSYVSIDVAGGSNTITLNAKEAWTFDEAE
ncbi:MAG: DNA-binding protein, partial [Muribaculaceae bacterium]|nr:DNA-binding protein [Muribaculaceae bacterium]